MKTFSRRSLAALALAASAIASGPAYAQRAGTTGTISLHAKAADVGVGYTWGDGVLRYHGHSYPFEVKGVNVAAVGYSSIVAHGRILNLHKISDFNGTYASSTGEATAGRGVIGQALINPNGVQIRLDGATKGARLSGSADGIELTLK